MAKRERIPAREPKPRYRVRNWRAYNQALVGRGAITLWIDEAVIAGWRAEVGRGRPYSDAAILCALSLRAVFKLALRQTQGFLEDLVRQLGLELEVPDYSTFSRRAADEIRERCSCDRRDRRFRRVVRVGLDHPESAGDLFEAHTPEDPVRPDIGGNAERLALDSPLFGMFGRFEPCPEAVGAAGRYGPERPLEHDGPVHALPGQIQAGFVDHAVDRAAQGEP